MQPRSAHIIERNTRRFRSTGHYDLGGRITHFLVRRVVLHGARHRDRVLMVGDDTVDVCHFEILAALLGQLIHRRLYALEIQAMAAQDLSALCRA